MKSCAPRMAASCGSKARRSGSVFRGPGNIRRRRSAAPRGGAGHPGAWPPTLKRAHCRSRETAPRRGRWGGRRGARGARRRRRAAASLGIAAGRRFTWKVMTLAGRIPRSSSFRRCRLLSSKPAPTSSTSATATWPTTRIFHVRVCSPAGAAATAAFAQRLFEAGRDAWIAGAMPNARPATSADPKAVEEDVTIECSRVRLQHRDRRRGQENSRHQSAPGSVRPRRRPRQLRLSVSSCRTIRQRAEPRAARTVFRACERRREPASTSRR